MPPKRSVQFHQPVFALPGIVITFQRGRGGAHQHFGAEKARRNRWPHRGHGSGVRAPAA